MAAACTGGAALRAAMTPSGGTKRRQYVSVIPKSTFTSYIDEGLMHLKKMSHRKAKYCFDRALELKSDDPLALISRSQCNMNLGLHEEALKDAERTFIVDKNFTPGLYQFGEVLFSLGYFEKALIYYHRGRQLRKNSVEFISGIVKSENAIRTAILDRAATRIEDIEEILPLIEEIETEDSLVKQQCCILPIAAETLFENRKPLLPPKNKQRERWVTQEILRDLAPHKFFVRNTLNKLADPRMQVGHSTKVKHNLTEILFFIEHHEKLLRYMKPMYYRKYELNLNSNKVKEFEQEYLQQQHHNIKLKRDTAEGAILKNVLQIEHSLSTGRYADAQLESERCIRQLKKMSSNLIERKNEFTMELMHYRSIALMRQKSYEQAVESFKSELKNGHKFKNDTVISRSLDFMARCHAIKGEFSEAIESWEAKMEYAKTPLEKAYTLHELGRSNLELGKKELSRYYANEAFNIASESENLIWATFAKILLAQVEVKASNYQEALDHFESARVVAKKADISQAMITMLDEVIRYLKICLERASMERRGTDQKSDEYDSGPSSPEEMREMRPTASTS